MAFGQHNLEYEVLEGWEQLPEGWSFVEVAGVDQVLPVVDWEALAAVQDASLSKRSKSNVEHGSNRYQFLSDRSNRFFR